MTLEERIQKMKDICGAYTTNNECDEFYEIYRYLEEMQSLVNEIRDIVNDSNRDGIEELEVLLDGQE